MLIKLVFFSVDYSFGDVVFHKISVCTKTVDSIAKYKIIQGHELVSNSVAFNLC